MLKIWRNKNVDLFLKEAYRKGAILSGLSAGSICWFKFGHSDSLKYRNAESQEYICVEGLGLVNGVHCPHYNEDDREENFTKMVNLLNITGIALENNCALELNDNKFKVIKADDHAKAYKVVKVEGNIIREELTNTVVYKSLDNLL